MKERTANIIIGYGTILIVAGFLLMAGPIEIANQKFVVDMLLGIGLVLQVVGYRALRGRSN
jgi:hypothetical protein